MHTVELSMTNISKLQNHSQGCKASFLKNLFFILTTSEMNTVLALTYFLFGSIFKCMYIKVCIHTV